MRKKNLAHVHMLNLKYFALFELKQNIVEPRKDFKLKNK